LLRHQLDPAAWSYTQWEGMLAAFLQDHDPTRELYLARPANPLIADPADWQEQQGHETRLRRVSRYTELIAEEDLRRWVQTVFNHLRSNTSLISAARQCLHRQSIQDDLQGREQALLDIAAKLPAGQAAQVVIISGAGRGKTCLAVEYAYRHQARYNSLLLVRCDNQGTLAASLAGLARCLKLAASDDADARAEALARHWLRDMPGWLLIVDNIDDSAGRAAALALLQDLGQGHALITSRDRHWPPSVTALNLDELAADAAARLLLAAGAGGQVRGTHAEAVALAEDLGRVANVLVQARAYLRARDLSIEQYHVRWRDTARRPQLLHEHDETVSGYPKSAAHTWLTTWDALSVPGRTLLNICSWLSSAPVPREDWPALVGVAPELPDLDAVELACAELRRFCLLKTLDGGLSAMHAIDQLIARNHQHAAPPSTDAPGATVEGQAWQWLLAVLVTPAAADLPQNYLHKERQWREHSEALLASSAPVPIEQRGELLLQLAVFSRARGDHAAALKLVVRAEQLPWAPASTVRQVLVRAGIACERSRIHYAKGQLSDAKKSARSGLEFLANIDAPDYDSAWNRLQADLIDQLGHVEDAKNQLDAARTAFAQAEAIRRALTEGALDTDAYRRDWSISLENLGRVAEKKFQLDAARTSYGQAETIRRRRAERAPDNDAYRRDWSISLANLGGVAEQKGELDAARAAFAQAEAISRALAERAPDNDAYRREWSISLENLGGVAEKMGQLDGARTAFAQVEATRRALAEGTPDNVAYRREWSKSLNNLGRIAENKNQLDPARATFAQAEAIRRALNRGVPDNDAYRRDWSISLENLGRVAEKKGELDAARTAFAQAEGIRRALAEGAPENDAYRQAWAISLHNVSRVAPDLNSALTSSKRSAECMRELVQRQSGELRWREELVRYCLRLLCVCASNAGHSEQAAKVLAEIETHLEVLLKAQRIDFVEEMRTWIATQRKPHGKL